MFQVDDRLRNICVKGCLNHFALEKVWNPTRCGSYSVVKLALWSSAFGIDVLCSCVISSCAEGAGWRIFSFLVFYDEIFEECCFEDVMIALKNIESELWMFSKCKGHMKVCMHRCIHFNFILTLQTSFSLQIESYISLIIIDYLWKSAHIDDEAFVLVWWHILSCICNWLEVLCIQGWFTVIFIKYHSFYCLSNTTRLRNVRHNLTRK